jgi:enterochelin esterase family protein
MRALSSIALAACLAFTPPAPARPEGDAKKSPPLSPRLAALQKDIEAAKPGALQAFWDGLKQAPLVEPIAGEPHHVYVTFLCRAKDGKDGDGNTAVACPLNYDKAGAGRLERLADTDLWYKTYRVRDDARFLYAFVTFAPATDPDKLTPQAQVLLRLSGRPDPLNPARGGPAGTFLNRQSLVELPAAAPLPLVKRRDGVPAGQLTKSRFKSRILDNERGITVYTPPGYSKDGPPCHLLVVFDRDQYLADAFVPTPVILDNLAAQGKIPPTVAVFVGNVNRNKELPCNDAFADFLAKELVPQIRADYRVTDKPEETVVGGSSYGGLASAFAAFRHPEVFGRVLSQSGSYWWTKEGDEEHEWLTRQFVASPRLPVRFYLDVGLWETGNDKPHSPTQVAANRHLRDVLKAKGYEVIYSEFAGNHDYFYWRGTFSDGLLSLVDAPKPAGGGSRK